MKQTHQIAYNYAQAIRQQHEQTELLHRALQTLNPDNQAFGLADPVEGAYSRLVQELLTPELWEWLQWWMWETNWGTEPREFSVNNQHYNAQDITLLKLLNLVDPT